MSKDDIIVDIGAGQGHGLLPMHESGYRNLIAVDIDVRNFSFFQAKYGIKCFKADMNTDRLPIETFSATLVLCFHLIEHLTNPSHFLSEVRRVLRPGGHIVLVTPDWRKQYKSFYRDPTHIHPYDKESIVRFLRMNQYEKVEAYSWGSTWGMGRLECYRWWRRLGMIGADLVAFARTRATVEDRDLTDSAVGGEMLQR